MYKSNLTQVLGQFSKDENEKRLQTLQKNRSSSLSQDSNNDLRFSIANNVVDRMQAYRLVYSLYIEKEFATPNKSKMWYSLFNANPNTITFVAKKKDTVVGTITIVIDSENSLPADNIFHDNVQGFRDTGKRPAEIISLAIDNNVADAQEILIKLFNYIYIAGRGLHSATDLVITINPKHAFFYKRKLLFNQVGETKAYDKVGGADAVLLCLNFKETEIILNKIRNENFKSKTIYPYFLDPKQEKLALFKMKAEKKPMSLAEFIYFFKDQINDPKNEFDTHLNRLKDYYFHESVM